MDPTKHPGIDDDEPTTTDTVSEADAAFALLATEDEKPAAKPRKRAPEKSTPHTDLHADRYDRYTLIAPDGKPVVVSRASTVIKALADTYNLSQWKQACVLRGVAARPDLSVLAASLDPSRHADKARMRKLVKEAEEAGGSKSAANVGTAVHAFCEALDTGAPDSLIVPRPYRADVAAYVATLRREGISILPDMVERTTMTTNWDGVGGTFDRIYRTVDGRHVIGDLKTGKVGYDPPEMYGQFAVYQDGVQQNGVYDRKGEDGRFPGTWTALDFDVDRDEALIVHLEAGKGTCVLYRADLGVGRRHLDRCARIRAERRERHTLRPYTMPDYEFPREIERERWCAALEHAESKDAADLLWRILSNMDLVDDDVKSLASEVSGRLTDLS